MCDVGVVGLCLVVGNLLLLLFLGVAMGDVGVVGDIAVVCDIGVVVEVGGPVVGLCWVVVEVEGPVVGFCWVVGRFVLL